MDGEGGEESAGAHATTKRSSACDDEHDDADLQRPAKRERAAAPDASSEKAPAADASSEKAPAADASSEKAPAAITVKTILDMFPLETIAGGIVALEPDEWIELESCVPLNFDLKDTKDYFFIRLLSDTHLFFIKDGPFKNCICCGLTMTGTHLQEWTTWDNWRNFPTTGECPKSKYLMLVFAQLYVSAGKVDLQACSAPAAHRVGEFRKIPKSSPFAERAAGACVLLEDYAFRLHEMVAVPAIEKLSKMIYVANNGRLQTTVVTCTHPTMRLGTFRSNLEFNLEIKTVVQKNHQDRYTDILKQFLVTQVQKEYITEQWAARTNQLRALLLRSSADILELHEDFQHVEENGIFGYAFFSIADNDTNNLQMFNDRVWEMVVADNDKVWNHPNQNGEHFSVQVKELLTFYNYFPRIHSSSEKNFLAEKANQVRTLRPRYFNSRLLHFRWTFLQD